MADIKISELTTASEIKNEDNIELSQNTGNGLVSLKATILALATKILTNINFTSVLTTTDKTITGAINEIAEGGGGGGGTGGHTIIDENGTSMTARAGLQFIGGANVSDDSTNNKTVVDLASAGGIDGVFVDTDNVIQSATSIPNGTSTYTATEDCIVAYQLVATASGCNIQIDNCIIDGLLTGSNYNVVSGNAYLKKGQVIKFVQTSSDAGTYTVYGIQTGTTHSKFQPVIYSTTEREIGVWTDGKPLYQKTYVKNNVGSNNEIVDANMTLSNISLVGFINNGIEMNSPYSGEVFKEYVSSAVVLRVFNSSSGLQCNLEGNHNYTGNVRFTVQYTKVSDTAGSGTWTPQGVPAVHYSTDEQIIGTWINGETLYEKTIDCGSISASTAKTVAHNISNFGRLVSYDIVAYNSSESRWNGIPRVDNDIKYQRGFGIDGTNIVIGQSQNAQALTNCYATIRYTKSL